MDNNAVGIISLLDIHFIDKECLFGKPINFLEAENCFSEYVLKKGKNSISLENIILGILFLHQHLTINVKTQFKYWKSSYTPMSSFERNKQV